MRSPKAFTLIELLIVVAIIAILAAIAVPNFLEAQVRSKVSRTKADMRTVATALEAYAVDENKYPPDFSQVLKGPAMTGAPFFRDYNKLIARLSHLTTPISYITSLPPDIFAETAASGGALRYNGNPFPPNAYQEGGDIIRPIVYDYATYDRDLVATNDESAAAWELISANPEGVQWALNSPGPDVGVQTFLGFGDLVIYDPTNGTVSFGQILRTNLGAEDDPGN